MLLTRPYTKPLRGTLLNRTHPLDRGLIGYWSLGEGTGKRAWDHSGNANEGVLAGGSSWTAGRKGWATNFDGVDGRVDCGNNAPLNDIGNGSFWLSF